MGAPLDDGAWGRTRSDDGHIWGGVLITTFQVAFHPTLEVTKVGGGWMPCFLNFEENHPSRRPTPALPTPTSSNGCPARPVLGSHPSLS